MFGTTGFRNFQEGKDMDTQAKHDHAGHPNGASKPLHPATGLKDPVCGMAVTEQSPHHLEHAGQPYYFCSAKCQARFAAEPARFVHAEVGRHAAPTPAPQGKPGTLYTCPMHPEIRQDHPGNCPKCGMSLEPVMPELDADENPELVDFQRRFWWWCYQFILVVVFERIVVFSENPPLTCQCSV